jgi:hypothetical protein
MDCSRWLVDVLVAVLLPGMFVRIRPSVGDLTWKFRPGFRGSCQTCRLAFLPVSQVREPSLLGSFFCICPGPPLVWRLQVLCPVPKLRMQVVQRHTLKFLDGIRSFVLLRVCRLR